MIVPEALNHTVTWWKDQSSSMKPGYVMKNVRVVDNRYLVDTGALSGSYSNFTVYWDSDVSDPLPYKIDKLGNMLFNENGPIREQWKKLQILHWDDAFHINVLTVKRVAVHYMPSTFWSSSIEYPRRHHVTLYCE